MEKQTMKEASKQSAKQSAKKSAGNRQSTLFKYRGIMTSVILLLLVTAGILGYNYYMSSRIAQGSLAANIAAREGVTVQLLAKDVLDIDLLAQEQQMYQGTMISDAVLSDIKELEESVAFFDRTLTAFEHGGTTTDEAGNLVTLEKASNPLAVKSIENAKAIWIPYKRLLDNFLSSARQQKVDADVIRFASEYGRIFNNRLFREVNDITLAVTADNDRDTQMVRLVQAVGFAVIFLLFLYIVFVALRRLMVADNELSEARKETTEILQTVKEGLFLVDKDLNVGSQHSTALQAILGRKSLDNQNVVELLEQLVPDEELDNTKVFIEQLYSEWVVEDLVKDLNPLRRISVQVPDENGFYEERFLNFDFSRVYEGEKIVRVLVSVEDITENVRLEEKLNEEREQNDRQLEMLGTLLNSDTQQVGAFIDNTKVRIEHINDILKTQEKGGSGHQNSMIALKEKANRIFREVHSLKGEASALRLAAFVGVAEEFEGKIKTLSNKHKIDGRDFLPLTVSLEELMTLTQFIENLSQRTGIIGHDNNNSAMNMRSASDTANVAVASNASAEVVKSTKPKVQNATPITDFFTNFANDIAKRSQKSARLHCQGLDDNFRLLSRQQQTQVKDISIQLIRNAVVHGIESSASRLQGNKPPVGTVYLKLQAMPASEQTNTGQMKLSIADDGQGIDFDALRKKAVELGLCSEAQSRHLNTKQLIKIMFMSGISTAETATEDAGRGVGMDIIKATVKQLQGQIKVNTVKQKQTHFEIVFPYSVK